MTDEPQRHRIEIACPECGHLQKEPALVISTQCRACRANFQVEDGKGVVRTQPKTRLAKPRKDGDPYPEPAKPKPTPPPRPATPPRRSLLQRLLYPTKPLRKVTCFGCDHAFTTVAEAHSSQCPKCGAYVSLQDYEITDQWNRSIQTCGNVIIRKTGSVSSATVRCHDLTVYGALSSPVECSGDLIIRSHGKIISTVHCHRLRVEKGARVEFLNPVTAITATIDGHVRGQISCSGTVTLEKRSQLHGYIRTASLIVKPGAKHTGTVEVIEGDKPKKS